MSELFLFVIGCLVTAATLTAVCLIGIGEADDVERLEREKRLHGSEPAPTGRAGALG